MPLFAAQKSGKINLDPTIIGLLSHSVVFAFGEEILRPISSSLDNMFFWWIIHYTRRKSTQCVEAFCHRSVDLAAHRRCVSPVTFYDKASGSTYQSPVLKGTEEGNYSASVYLRWGYTARDYLDMIFCRICVWRVWELLQNSAKNMYGFFFV